MSTTLQAVKSENDILPVWRDNAVGQLLRYQNLGGSPSPHPQPALLIATCFEQQAPLRIPEGFAIQLRTAAASLKRDPFKVSWAVGIAGVQAIALVAHDHCGLVGLTGHREAFIRRMIETAGWEQSAAEQHFDHWSDLFQVDDPADFVAGEAARLRIRYPGIPVAPLLYIGESATLQQVLA